MKWPKLDLFGLAALHAALFALSNEYGGS